MEGPVLTSASSHRLRSAVSACAQPTHSYFSSSYLGTSFQCASHNSGGCIKKFHCFGKNGETSFLDKLNVTKKVKSSNDSPTSCKRHKIGSKNCLSHYCGLRIQQKSKQYNVKEVENLSGTETRTIYPTQFMIRKELLSKLTLNKNVTDSKRLENYLDSTSVNEGDNKKCKKVIINGKISPNIDKKNRSNDRCISSINRSPSAKTLNYCTNKCSKVKNKNNKKNSDGFLFGKNVDSNEERSDECYSFGVRDEENLEEGRNEKQEISKWQPKHVVTRRTAQIVREIRNVWEKRVGSSKLVPAENVRLLFNDLQLFPSASQVVEMLKCAQECSKNPSSKHLTFGEFYKFANDLIRTECRIPSTSPSPRVLEKNVEKRRGKFSRGMSKYEVFLGGSCNPTTWRTDFAIPELENMNISYYNPQVEEWRPELLEVEYQAKENATVMFFVIDNQTRGVSTLIEVAHLAAHQRKLILVIQSYTQKNQIICDEQISENEYEDLKTGQEVLQTLVERQKIPIFDDIRLALKSTEKILRENITARDLVAGNADRETSLRPQEVFEKLDSLKTGRISLIETCLAFKLLHLQNFLSKNLETFIKKLGNNINGSHFDWAKIDLDSFMKLINEFERQQEIGQILEPTLTITSCNFLCDVYLGGTLENTEWRESIAIPMLNSKNLRYFIPKVCGGKMQYSEIEAVAMESSFTLLFVITGTARSIAAMAIAGHYIGLGANVVLCVQYLPEGVALDSEILTERAIKDYNRGRAYLMDIAKRSGVSVFEEISKAVEFVIEKCLNRSDKIAS